MANDAFTVKSLRDAFDKMRLADSMPVKYNIVVLPEFFAKQWPKQTADLLAKGGYVVQKPFPLAGRKATSVIIDDPAGPLSFDIHFTPTPKKKRKKPMPKYTGTKTVQAFKITAIGGHTSTTERQWLLSGDDYVSAVVDEKYVTKHEPQVGGYYVLYEDGYESFSPASTFEAAYKLGAPTKTPVSEEEKYLGLIGTKGLSLSVNVLAYACHKASADAGWWEGVDMTDKHVIPAKLCLIHSEISEAMEGARKDLMDDKLPHRKMLEVELADAIIRIGDLAGKLGLDLGGAIVEKMAFNKERVDHKPENRAKEGGKAF